MARVKVGLANLSDIDNGQILAEFDTELKRIVKDCLDRPGLAKARKVTLTAIVEPDSIQGTSQAQITDSAYIGFEVTSKIPSLRGKQYQVQVHGNGNIMVNPASPDDVRQGTLDELTDGSDSQ